MWIHGNEVAGREAKIVVQSADIVFRKVPPLDIKEPARSCILGKWLERWAFHLLVSS